MITVKPVYSEHLGPNKTVLIIEVSLVHRFIYIAQLTVLIIEVSLFQSVYNSRFDCIATTLYTRCINTIEQLVL